VAIIAAFVPGYSGGTTPDSHRLPSWPFQALALKYVALSNNNYAGQSQSFRLCLFENSRFL
jgi:hypothetical protein